MTAYGLAGLGRYWRTPVLTIRRWWYDKDKPADVALITVALMAVARRDAETAATIAAVLYFGIGKLLVSMEVIPHGGHKPVSHEAVRWVAEIALCSLVPALIWAVSRGLMGLWLAGAVAAVYFTASVLYSTFADA